MDNPIESSSQDLLDRTSLARSFARNLRSIDASRGAVVSILGPWGYGKSSFINLMREEFNASPSLVVIDFNPWMFSGTQQLVEHFFDEFASNFKQLRDPKFQAIASYIDAYGESVSSIASLFGGLWSVGAGVFRISARKLAKKRGARAKYEKASTELGKLSYPVVVVIDDIDRLSSEEIRDIFKLVRLTASFPNVIYLLAFDRKRVESALDEPGVSGRAYLEKIVQVSFDLPATPRKVLTSELLFHLEAVFHAVEGKPRFTQERWPDVYFEIIAPIITNMRDVARFSASVRPILAALGTDAEVVDLLALEALRIFRPELFSHLRNMRVTLTETDGPFSSTNPSASQTKMDDLLALSGPESDMIRALMRLVFPAASKYYGNNHYGSDWQDHWRRDHRLAHADYLSMYFDRIAPNALRSFQLAERLVAVMSDPIQFAQVLDSADPADLPDILSALESFQDDYPETEMSSAIAALMNRTHLVPETQVQGIFTLSPEVIVIRPVIRMLQQVPDDVQRAAIVRNALGQIRTYSSRLDLIRRTGRRKETKNLIPESLAIEFESELLADFLANPPANISDEWDLAGVYDFVGVSTGEPSQLASERSPEITRRMLRSAQRNIASQAFDSRYVKKQAAYQWEGLLALYGSEENLSEAVSALRKADGPTEMVVLAERYLDGWRPRDDDESDG